MITTITLELVRHGPLHNQLLSPLTPYIALAGNRPAETVHVPVEHAQMMAKLRRLRHVWDDAAELRAARDFRAVADIREASQVVTRFLESIHGLSEAIAERLGAGGDEGEADVDPATTRPLRGPATDGIIHLRLIVSANELSMLPFELAQGPLAFGGSDMLSALRPPLVVITRESRRSGVHQFKSRSAEMYRVLVVAADPERRGLPLEACLLALRYAVPLHLHDTRGGSATPADLFRENVEVLVDASLDDIRQALAAEDYSHVLVLAHGRMPESLDGRPTILFHANARRHETDAVSGERLAAALCPPRAENTVRHRKPMFVSLMVCDSGNPSQTVLFAGGSIAHTIHEAGVPFVVASQFPLTFAGAVLVTEVLFERLMHNQHPIAAIAEARQRLFTELGTSHDWAALVAYATLPDDTTLQERVRQDESQALTTTLAQAMDAVDAAERAAARAQVTGEGATVSVEAVSGHRALGVEEVTEDFEEALFELRAFFDAKYEAARHEPSETEDYDRRSIQQGHAENHAREAAIIANAFLRYARLLARRRGLLVYHELGQQTGILEQDRAALPGGRGLPASVRDAIVASEYYARAHMFFGGRSLSAYTLRASALECLGRGGDLRGARKWWDVVDWFFSDRQLSDPQSNSIYFRGSLLFHLLVGVQMGVPDLDRRIDECADHVAEIHSAHGSHASHQTFRWVLRRLSRYREDWWGPDSPASRRSLAVEERWRGTRP